MPRKKLSLPAKNTSAKEAVFECIICGYRYIDTVKIERCPTCNQLNTIVICSNYIVTT